MFVSSNVALHKVLVLACIAQHLLAELGGSESKGNESLTPMWYVSHYAM